MIAPGIGKVACFRAGACSANSRRGPVNREAKRGRIVKVAPVAPPRMFNAGSILERQSSLDRAGAIEPDLAMAFIEPEIAGRELEIAPPFT
jgi:hypothetical protein